MRLLDVTPPYIGGTNIVIPVNQAMGGSISCPSLSRVLEILNIASTLEMFKNKDSSSKKHGFNWSAYGRLEFVSLLEKTRERTTYMKRQVASEDDEHLRMSEFIALVIDSDFKMI